VVLCAQCGSPLRENDRFCAACGASCNGPQAPKDPLVGRTIAGSYTVLDMVGVGGMGRVYRAEQRMLGRTVAIKVIHPHLLSDEQSVARFYNEARAASRLNHPNSVSIIDFGRTDDGILYLVMEYLQGRDLVRVVREDGLLPIPRVCDVLMAVLAALGEAHALGVVHRDLKPENIILERMRTGADLVKVVDFGLAKLLGTHALDSSITSPGLVCGTPDYMSPEQGRGMPVDERGDIYSVGVVLFELLTDQLPFLGDTPTDVVLRHIQEPVPDPRAIAPNRGIPTSLVDVVMRALAKDATRRYQTAKEMGEALRAVVRQLAPVAAEVSCPACGVRSSPAKRFCGECGAPLQQQAPSAPLPRMSLPPSMRAVVSSPGPLLGREEQMERLLSARERAVKGAQLVWLIGEAGIGKTRLLGELARRAANENDLVVGVGPHDTGAPVPYRPIHTLVCSLHGIEGSALAKLADDLVGSDPLVAAGLRELQAPSGLRGSEQRSRAGAVAAALDWSVGKGMQRVGATRTLLLVDDLHRADGLTAQAVAAFALRARERPILLVAAGAQSSAPDLLPDAELINVTPLNMAKAYKLMSGSASMPNQLASDERLFLPLYLEQLRSLGLSLDAPAHTLPRRLADAVAQRVERLSLSARRLLQAACVLGDRCERSMLLKLAGGGDDQGLSLLKAVGLLVEHSPQLEVVHPFVRDLVEASIPAEARKALHAHALELVAEADAPLEVRAQHAFGAGEAFSALMLLERTGDLALERGDPSGAVLAFRRGLDLARREMLESGETSLEDAIASFSRKLGHALVRQGDFTGAEGVLREGLEFCAPSTLLRAQVLLGLGRALASRRRVRDAYRLLGEALEIATTREDNPTQAAIHFAIGEVRRSEANLVGAVAAFTSGMQCLAGTNDRLALARGAVELASALAHGTSPESALEALTRARDLARDAQAPHLEALVAEATALVHDANGRSEVAISYIREALRIAEHAGDAITAARCKASLNEAPPSTKRASDRPGVGV
jgi:serine/threonine-protein kinase